MEAAVGSSKPIRLVDVSAKGQTSGTVLEDRCHVRLCKLTMKRAAASLGQGNGIDSGQGWVQQEHQCHKMGGQGGISCCIGMLRGLLDRLHNLSKDDFHKSKTINAKTKIMDWTVTEPFCEAEKTV